MIAYYRNATEEEARGARVIDLCVPVQAPTPRRELERQRDGWLEMVRQEPNHPLVDHWAAYAAVLQSYVEADRCDLR